MLKKILLVTLAVVVAVGAGLYLFRDAAVAIAADLLTGNMFVDAEAATLEVGIPVGERFPEIRAVHEDRTVTDVAEFLGPNGLVLMANRSAVW
jgi:hypothetical protein